MPADSQRLHLHIDNSTALGEIFEITRERFDAAAARHPEIAARLTATIGADGEGFAEAMRSADALFGWNFERDNLAAIAPRLRLIQIQGAGINHVLPLDWVPPGAVLTNSSGAHGARASEYLIMALLALNCGLPSMASAQREHRWAPVSTSAAGGKTLLIFGVGAVGGSFATQAKKFGLHVLGVRRSGQAHPHVDEMVTPDQLHTLLPRADFIAVTAPQTPQTQQVFGPREFALIKEGAGLIVYSRSQLVDYNAMRERLAAGTLTAFVDVFDEEPLPASSPLWDAPNLIITPHSSSNDPQHHASRSLDLLFDNLGRLLKSDQLINVVDPALQY